MALACSVSLQRTLDLLHERLVLENIKRLLLPLPVLRTDDEVFWVMGQKVAQFTQTAPEPA